NGGLFADHDVDIPQFTDEIVELLLHEVSAGTDWSTISPTIFGGVFDSTLNPETRHAGACTTPAPQISTGRLTRHSSMTSLKIWNTLSKHRVSEQSSDATICVVTKTSWPV